MREPRRIILACLTALALCATVLGSTPAAAQGDEPAPPVVIAEIYYNPDGAAEFDEFVELYNASDTDVDVSGWRFSDGIDFTFEPDTILGASERFVITSDFIAFVRTFDFAPDDTFVGSLSNGGERLTLETADGVVVDSVTYDDAAPWPTSADGDGSSLQILDPLADNDVSTNWGAGAPTPATTSIVDVDLFFSQSRGWYSGNVTVALTATVPGATIRYNTNGSGSLDQTYSGPITLSDNGSVQVIQAQASLDASSGPFATNTYVFKPDRGVATVATWNVPIPVQPGESERVMSFEFLPPPSTGLIAVQGNAGQSTSQAGVSRGQSDKVFFRGDYGNGTLNGDLFSDVYDDGYLPPANEFDQLFLRYEHLDATHQKQLLAHDALLAMGSLAPHGRFVEFHDGGALREIRHLHERPEGGFMEAYTDIDKDNWFGSSAVDPPNPSTWAEVQQSFDPQQVTDYMLADWHSQDPDSGDSRNVRAAGPAAGVGDGDLLRWAFFPWDKDFAYLPATSGDWPYVKREGPESPSFMWQSPGSSRFYLHGIEEMRYLMADRARCAFQPGGALHGDTFHARLVERHDEYVRAGGPDLGGFWVNPMDQWLDRRVEGLLAPLRSGNSSTSRYTSTGNELYPSANPVSVTTAGQTITLSSSNPGTIYYRLDGGDPRTLLGELEPEAIAYTGPITLPVGRTEIIARSFDTARANRFQAWSPACNEPLTYDLVAVNGAPIELVITEIHYNPPTEGLVDGDLREYVEIHNPGVVPVDLAAMQLDGTGLTFPFNTVVEPGGYLVVASDADEFTSSYGAAPDAVYPGRLDDGGEAITLVGADGSIIDTVTYDDVDPWPTAADAGGASLNLSDVAANNASPANWAAATRLSPGAENITTVRGDVNCSDTVDIVDALVLAQYAVGNRGEASCPFPDAATGMNLAGADFNGDELVTIVDALLISQCVVGIENAFCEI